MKLTYLFTICCLICDTATADTKASITNADNTKSYGIIGTASQSAIDLSNLTSLKRALDHAQDARTVVKNEYFRLLAESLAPAEQFWLRKRDANYLEKSASMQKLTEICHRQRIVDVNDAPFLAKHIICFDSGGVIDNFYEKPSVSSILKTLGRHGSQACLQEIKTMKFQNPDPPTLVKLTYLVRVIKSDTQEFVNQSVLELGADHYAVKNGYLSVKS